MSEKYGLPSETGIPIFNIDEKTLLKNKFKIPGNAALFGYII